MTDPRQTIAEATEIHRAAERIIAGEIAHSNLEQHLARALIEALDEADQLRNMHGVFDELRKMVDEMTGKSGDLDERASFTVSHLMSAVHAILSMFKSWQAQEAAEARNARLAAVAVAAELVTSDHTITNWTVPLKEALAQLEDGDT